MVQFVPCLFPSSGLKMELFSKGPVPEYRRDLNPHFELFYFFCRGATGMGTVLGEKKRKKVERSKNNQEWHEDDEPGRDGFLSLLVQELKQSKLLDFKLNGNKQKLL